MTPIATLTTDFGIDDPYVGAVKGVLLRIAPALTIVDITHSVPPQAIVEGAFLFGSVYRYFPPHSIHVVVVDPGVGSDRRPIAVETAQYCFVAPDNGVLTCALEREEAVPHSHSPEPMRVPLAPGVRAVHLNRPEFWLPQPSATFHGRDIFAPIAAHLANQVPLDSLGDAIGEVLVQAVPSPVWHNHGHVQGQVIHVDRFGNLITNLRPSDLPDEPVFEIGGREVRGLVPTYSERQGLVALVGSTGNVEFAVPNGSAAALLGALPGQTVRARTRNLDLSRRQ